MNDAVITIIIIVICVAIIIGLIVGLICGYHKLTRRLEDIVFDDNHRDSNKGE